MKILFKVSIAGTSFSYAAGEEVELPNNVALMFVDAGYAEVVDTSAPARREQKIEEEQPVETRPSKRRGG